jgi:predicted RNA binding protein YcfA (HicA-like mRNA interferase family)
LQIWWYDRMSKIPAVRPKKLLQILENKGFFIHHQRGSHVVLKSKFDSSLRITLPLHNKDLKRKTLVSILKQAGLTKEIF